MRSFYLCLSVMGLSVLALSCISTRTALAASHPAADTPASAASQTWDKAAAARYLDSRQSWWQDWPHAQKDHGTVCVSCHTHNSKDPQCHKVFLKAIPCRWFIVYNYTARPHIARVSVVSKWFPFSTTDKVKRSPHNSSSLFRVFVSPMPLHSLFLAGS